jgi:hypothetical protein
MKYENENKCVFDTDATLLHMYYALPGLATCYTCTVYTVCSIQ